MRVRRVGLEELAALALDRVRRVPEERDRRDSRHDRDAGDEPDEAVREASLTLGVRVDDGAGVHAGFERGETGCALHSVKRMAVIGGALGKRGWRSGSLDRRQGRA
jgi:hypothetical protein